MSQVLVTESNLSDIADAIREKLGVETTYKPGDMAAAVLSITGETPTLITKSITENGTYDADDDDADGYSSVTVNVAGGGGGSTNILSGTSEPSSSVGSNGDIYLRYLPAYIKNSSGQYINTGYRGNSNTKYIVDFLIAESQNTDWPCIFGGRPNAGNVVNAESLTFAYSQGVHTAARPAWGGYENTFIGFGANDLIGKRAIIELSAGNIKFNIDGTETTYTFTCGNVTDSTPIILFTLGVNGSPQSYSYMKGTCLFSFAIYENDTLVHKFVPALDSNNVPCVYDEIAEEYKYNGGSGSFEYSEDDVVLSTYCKVNGIWQNLIGTDIEDINTGNNS